MQLVQLRRTTMATPVKDHHTCRTATVTVRECLRAAREYVRAIYMERLCLYQMILVRVERAVQ